MHKLKTCDDVKFFTHAVSKIDILLTVFTHSMSKIDVLLKALCYCGCIVFRKSLSNFTQVCFAVMIKVYNLNSRNQ